MVKYAESWEGRELYALIIAEPEKFRRLDEIKTGLRRLAAPTAASLADEARLIKELPVVVALLHGVHGNEISSGEAAMAEAYHLLAAQGDPTVDLIRRETIVIIDPMQNPDGRARFVFQNLLGQAASPDPEPTSIEHDEPWPGGRSNHYLFDLNRDWYAQLHPESQGRVKLLLEWMPQVVVDLHEMGGDSTYYFPPAADPPNPLRTETQQRWFEVFGKEIAARFDQRGFLYFNREVYDSFYPGYGASWPILQGAIGMTFEMASARGLIYRRRDDSILTYLDGAVRHFTAAIATAATAARNREKLLRDFTATRRTAGAGPVKAYLLPPGNDRGQTQRLVDTLQQNGVLVFRSSEPIKVEGRTLPVGTFIVPLPQPAGLLARNLLDAQVRMNDEFVKRQDDRRKKRLPDQIYDITAWNLPMLYDVECIATDRPITVKAADPETVPLEPSNLEEAIVGYLLPWNATGAAAVIEALNNGIRVRFLYAGFTSAGRKYDRGAAIIRKAENGEDLRAKLGAIIARHRAEVYPLNSAFIEEGISLGSNQVVALKSPRVLLAWDAPTGSLSAGWTRFTLEQRYRQGVTTVRVSSLSRVDLRRYDVIILPAGNYSPALSGEVLRRIRDWVSAGGTLITIGEASRWASRESVGLLETKTELRDGTPESETAVTDKSAKQDSTNNRLDYQRSIQPLREQPELTPGALLRVALDAEHWLTSGTDGEIQALVESTRVFTPIKLDRGRNVGVYAVKERIQASGLIWEEALNQLPQKAYLIYQPLGGGHIVAFAEEPNFRAYTEATMLLFINAVLFGPAY
ncbi:MAG: M14 family metallopeptidase [Acidobacteria bacterium]|nr:M14 family metallopeptidase [Acidobacteriota bacterium]